MERRDEPERQSLIEMVAAIRKDTAEIKTALFGPEGQAWMGFIPRTDIRLGEHDTRIAGIEKRMWVWIGALTILIPATVAAVEHYLR